MLPNTHIAIKYIVVGDSGTGKTSLLQHFFNDAPPYNEENLGPQATVGVDHLTKRIMTERYGAIDCCLWDTSGMEKYNSVSLTQAFYRGAHGVLLVFDVTSRQSFEHLTDIWLKRLRTTATMHSQCKYIMVGNKIDLHEKLRQVSTEEAAAVAHQHGMQGYIEVSSHHSDCTLIRMPFILLANELITTGVCKRTECPPEVVKRVSPDIGEEKKCCGDG
jgi:small GTP-binding protein